MLVRFVNFRNPYMALNNLPEHGFTSLLRWLRSMGMYKARQIILYSSNIPRMRRLLFLLSMLMILSWLRIIQMKWTSWRKLPNEFEIKDLGPLKYFLGMEIARSKKGIVVSQWKYVLDLLQATGMLGCKPSDTPMESNYKAWLMAKSPPTDKGRYQRLVGKLIYLSHTT